MNVYDAERMGDVLAPLGYAPAASPESADLVILNTCHIREKAAEKVYSELGRLKTLKQERAKEGRPLTISVGGCVAQAEGEEVARRAKSVDLVFGPQSYHRLPELLEQTKNAKETVLDTDFPVEDKFAALPSPRSGGQVSAFLTIQEGCDKFCTFCVVPYTRGSEYSRPAAQILTDARKLADGGVREVTLLGQNVNAYHGDGPDGTVWNLATLARAIAEIDGINRIRYTTSHPRDMDDELIAAHGELDQLMPFLHLPVQSGSDRILKEMNRQHTAESYIRLVERIRAARPDLALSCDFIVGFPGETDAEFEMTMNLIREVTFAQAYSFKYSPRPGTPAAGMDDQIDEAVKTDRLAQLQALIDEQQATFNQSAVSQDLPVLFEKKGRHEGQLVGRSPYLQPVHINATDHALIGQIRQVHIDEAVGYSLMGHLSEPDSSQQAAE